jgi:hypothetical protein
MPWMNTAEMSAIPASANAGSNEIFFPTVKLIDMEKRDPVGCYLHRA